MQSEVVHNINTPFLIILGGKDTAVHNPSAKRFIEHAPATVKELIVHEEASHEICQDKEYAYTIIDETVTFFDSRLNKK